MNLLYAADYVGSIRSGGGGIVAFDEMMALLSTGADVSVAAHNRVPVPETWLGARVRQPRWIRLPAADGLARWRRWRARRQLGRLRPDLMIMQGEYPHRLLESYRDWSGIPRAMIMESSPAQSAGVVYSDGRSSLDRLREEIRAYSDVVCVADAIVQPWKDALGEAAAGLSFTVIRNTCDETPVQRVLQRSREEVRAELGMDSSLNVVCIASIQHRKGQDILLRAWRKVRANVPSATLHLSGPMPPGRGGEAILAEAANVPGVRVDAKAGRAAEYLRAADLSVLVSREEGLPLSLVEAAAIGVPCVASGVDGNPEIVVDGENGLLAPQEDADATAAALIELLQNPARRVAMGKRASAIFEERFSRARYAREWRAFVEKVASRRPSN